MKRNLLTAVILSLGLAFSFAHASGDTTDFSTSGPSPFGVSAKIGTTGVGLDLSASYNEYLAGRVGWSGGSLNKSYSSNGVNYDGKLSISDFNLLADVYPFGGMFRITGGIYQTDTKFTGTGSFSNGSITLNGQTYTAAQLASVSGTAKINGVKPYLGIGFDGFNSAKTAGFFASGDLGVIFTGSPTGTLTSTCAAGASAAVCSSIQANTAAQQSTYNNEVNKIKYWPVLSVSLGYRF